MPCDPNQVQVEGVPNVVNFPIEELSHPSIHLGLSPFGRQEFTIPTFWHLTEKVLHELLELRRGVFVDHDEFDK